MSIWIAFIEIRGEVDRQYAACIIPGRRCLSSDLSTQQQIEYDNRLYSDNGGSTAENNGGIRRTIILGSDRRNRPLRGQGETLRGRDSRTDAGMLAW